MANVTDEAFRRLITTYGKPDVMYTEFVSADGLLSRGQDALLADLRYSESERPIVAQLFTAHPDRMERAAALVQRLGFDGVDINMGCPDRAVERQGAGAALIKNPARAAELIAAAKRGAGNIPVSIKTRIGYRADTLEEWLSALFRAEPTAVILHARTRNELSRTPAHWESIRRAVALRDAYATGPAKTLIIGNGDIETLDDAARRIKETGADGVMVGRGMFGTPWFFERLPALKKGGVLPKETPRSPEERLSAALAHTALFEEIFGATRNFDIMKKHYTAYVRGWNGAKELRTILMGAKNGAEAATIIRSRHSAL